MPMPVNGARATDGAFQTAAIPRTSNAGPPFSAWGAFAGQIRSPERPTGRAPATGMHPIRQSAFSAPISKSQRTSAQSYSRRFLAKWPFEWTSVSRRDAYGTQLKLLRNGLRIFCDIRTFVEGRC